MQAIKPIEITKITQNQRIETPDLVVVEEPLEIRLNYGKTSNRKQISLSVTMRTPTGHDFELALGFLFTEGIIHSPNDIQSIKYCVDAGKQQQENIVKVELKPDVNVKVEKLERHFYTTSSCGICGKTSIEAIEAICEVLPPGKVILPNDFILSLPKLLKEKQFFYQHTGGFHAAAIINPKRNIEIIREDIGRHNALDKAIGAAFQLHLLPLNESVLFVSSRASFELVQKAIMAGISTFISIGSPSSLAIETAQKFGMTLIGFLKEDSFNVYFE